MSLQTAKPIRVDARLLALLEELTNTNGVSGDEGAIRAIIRKQVAPYADEIKTDAMGNLLVIKHASQPPALRVMMDAHMDEVGFMIVEEEGDGLFVFEKVGNCDERQLLSKAVLVGHDNLPGVIGCKPIHLAEEDEISSPVPLSAMRIDLGPAAKGKAKRGDFATYATRFLRSGDAIFAKALDDRMGCATLIELLKHVPPQIEFLAAFSVQEEIGLRGARVAAYDFQPDLAIAIDSTPAVDMPRPDGRENTQYNCKLGAGPAIYLADAGTLSDPRLVNFLTRVAEENHLNFQFRQPGGGGTDAGALHLTGKGCPVVSVSIPGRYAHTAVMMSSLRDWQNALQLLQYALLAMTPELITSDRP